MILALTPLPWRCYDSLISQYEVINDVGFTIKLSYIEDPAGIMSESQWKQLIRMKVSPANSHMITEEMNVLVFPPRRHSRKTLIDDKLSKETLGVVG